MASEDLNWFSCHPLISLSLYAERRAWDPYDETSGKGRYKFVRHLQNAPRNKGQVSFYHDMIERRNCAVKSVPLDVVNRFIRQHDVENPLVDSGTLRYLTLFHPSRHIARWYDCCYDREFMYFVSELGAHGDLFGFLERNNSFDEATLKKIMFEILDGVDCMHSARVAHLDLSVENVVLREAEDGFEAMLIDMGQAEVLIPNNSYGPKDPRNKQNTNDSQNDLLGDLSTPSMVEDPLDVVPPWLDLGELRRWKYNSQREYDEAYVLKHSNSDNNTNNNNNNSNNSSSNSSSNDRSGAKKQKKPSNSPNNTNITNLIIEEEEEEDEDEENNSNNTSYNKEEPIKVNDNNNSSTNENNITNAKNYNNNNDASILYIDGCLNHQNGTYELDKEDNISTDDDQNYTNSNNNNNNINNINNNNNNINNNNINNNNNKHDFSESISAVTTNSTYHNEQSNNNNNSDNTNNQNINTKANSNSSSSIFDDLTSNSNSFMRQKRIKDNNPFLYPDNVNNEFYIIQQDNVPPNPRYISLPSVDSNILKQLAVKGLKMPGIIVPPLNTSAHRSPWRLSKHLKGKTLYQDVAMTPNTLYDAAAADVFSVGVILVFLIMVPILHKYPWNHEESKRTAIHQITQIGVRRWIRRCLCAEVEQRLRAKYQNHPNPPTITPQQLLSHAESIMPNVSESAYDLIQNLLNPIPHRRLTALEAKLHGWFAFDEKFKPRVLQDILKAFIPHPCQLIHDELLRKRKPAKSVCYVKGDTELKNYDDITTKQEKRNSKKRRLRLALMREGRVLMTQMICAHQSYSNISQETVTISNELSKLSSILEELLQKRRLIQEALNGTDSDISAFIQQHGNIRPDELSAEDARKLLNDFLSQAEANIREASNLVDSHTIRLNENEIKMLHDRRWAKAVENRKNFVDAMIEKIKVKVYNQIGEKFVEAIMQQQQQQQQNSLNNNMNNNNNLNSVSDNTINHPNGGENNMNNNNNINNLNHMNNNVQA